MGLAIALFLRRRADCRRRRRPAGADRLRRTSGAGAASRPGQFNFPVSDRRRTGTGNVYVADSENDRVQKFIENGDFLTRWGGDGLGAGAVLPDPDRRLPSTPAGRFVYVADKGNNRIQIFSRRWRLRPRMGQPAAAGRASSSHPEGIAIDAAGNVYVADTGNNRIRSSPTRGPSSPTGASPAKRQGQFNAPNGVAIDTAGNVYVSDSGNDRIQKFTGAGVFVANGARPATARVSSTSRSRSPPTPPARSTWPTWSTTGSRSSAARANSSASGARPARSRGSSNRRWRSRPAPAARSSLPTPATTGSRSSANCPNPSTAKRSTSPSSAAVIVVKLPGSTKRFVSHRRAAAPGRVDHRRQPRPRAALLVEGPRRRYPERRLLLGRLPRAAAQRGQAADRAQTRKRPRLPGQKGKRTLG